MVSGIAVVSITALIIMDITAKAKSLTTRVISRDSKRIHATILTGLFLMVLWVIINQASLGSVFLPTLLYPTVFLVTLSVSFYKLITKGIITKPFVYMHIVTVSALQIIIFLLSMGLIRNIIGENTIDDTSWAFCLGAGLFVILIVLDWILLNKQKNNISFSKWYCVPSYFLFILLIISIYPFLMTGGYITIKYVKLPFGSPIIPIVYWFCAIISVIIVIAYLAAIIKRLMNKPITKFILITTICLYLFLIYNIPGVYFFFLTH